MPTRRTLFAFLLVPIAVPFPVALLEAQESAADVEWREECRMQVDDRPRDCQVLVETVVSPASAIAFETGRNGGVEVVGWDRRTMEIHARVVGHGDTDAEARETARAVRLEAGPGSVRAVGPDDGTWFVVLRVFAPRERDLEASTVNGPLSVEGVNGRMRLATKNGPIHLVEVGGDVRARAQNGPIEVVLSGATWSGQGLDAEAQNGPVRVEIPRGYRATFETGTQNGPFRTEIPLTVQPGTVGKRIRTELGGGGPLVRVVTTNGPVEIARR